MSTAPPRRPGRWWHPRSWTKAAWPVWCGLLLVMLFLCAAPWVSLLFGD